MDINYYIFQFPKVPNIYCAFQGRSCYSEDNPASKAGNISFLAEDSFNNVLRTRDCLLKDLHPLGLNSWSECKQVHGDWIYEEPSATATGAMPNDLPQADGMLSSAKGLGLMIKTADCQPLFIADFSGEHIMALHVGWRGNRINLPGKAVILFCNKYKLEPKNLIAVRGPSLGPAASEFVNFNQEWGEKWKRWFDENSMCMNLWELTKWQLHNPANNYPGIPYENIYGIDICTYLNSHSFFSYRKKRDTGRQANLIWIVK